MRSRAIPFAAFAAASLIGLTATAQTGIQLLAKPWADNTSVEINDLTADFYAPGHEEDESSRFTLNQVQSDGRLRFAADDLLGGQKIFYTGYSVNYLDLSSHGPLLPDRLLDTSVAAGFPIADLSGNVLAFSGGVGYAGDNPLAQRTGAYGKGDLLLVHDFGDNRRLGIGLDYDGNRVEDPDFPIPGFGYQATYGNDLLYVVGFPYSSLQWRPRRWKMLTLSADYAFPSEFDAAVRLRLIPHVELFAKYKQDQDGFHIDDQPYDRRLFFEQQKAELGVDFTAADHVILTLAGGYAFDQRFYRGYDLSNLDIVTAVSDVPYARINLTVSF